MSMTLEEESEAKEVDEGKTAGVRERDTASERGDRSEDDGHERGELRREGREDPEEGRGRFVLLVTYERGRRTDRRV